MSEERVEDKTSRLKTWAQMSGFPSNPAKKICWHFGQASVPWLVGDMYEHIERAV